MAMTKAVHNMGSRISWRSTFGSLRWRHNEWDGVSNHQPHHCLLNRLSGRRSKKTSKPRLTGLCAGNSPGTGEFPAQMASNAENVSIWCGHHVSIWTWKYVCQISHIPGAHFTSHFSIIDHIREISLCPHSCRNEVITMKFCTWHDSSAVLACAKFLPVKLSLWLGLGFGNKANFSLTLNYDWK